MVLKKVSVNYNAVNNKIKATLFKSEVAFFVLKIKLR